MKTSELLKKVRQIEIKTKGLSNHIFAGEYHTAFKGTGMAFSEVREYVNGDDLRTIPVGLASIVGQYQIDWGFLLAGATLASLPVIFLFLFVGKYFVSGLTDGAIK